MQARLSIGVVCYSSLGGSGVVAAEIAAGMAARGHGVHMIASGRPRRATPGVHFHEVAPVAHPVIDQPPYTLAVAGVIVEVARRHGLDVVHAHYAVPHVASAYLAAQALAAKGRRPRLVTTLHGTDVTQIGVDAAIRPITAFALAACDAVTVPSSFLCDEAVRSFDLLPAAIETIPNFVDTDRFAPPRRHEPDRLGRIVAERSGGEAPRGPFLVHVSNFRPVKRAADLLTVLAKLRAAVPAHLILIGDGPQLDATAERAEAMGLGDAVTFVGEQSDFAELLSRADAMLLTSESESFGVAALEAMSCGVPVFAYRVGGLAEVVSDDSGVLVEPFDADALAAALAAVLRDDDRRQRMRAAARARAVDFFRAEPILDRYEQLYRRVAGER